MDDLILISDNCKELENTFLTSGISYREFIEAVEPKPKNILIITDDYTGLDFDRYSGCSYRLDEDVINLAYRKHRHIEADFIWTDFENLNAVHSLTPTELAELYYVRKQWAPINQFSVEKIKNNYYYLSHDDSFLSIIWYRNKNVFYSFLGRAVCSKLNYLHDIILEPFDIELAKKLCSLADALTLYFKKLSIDKDNNILIPIYSWEKLKDVISMNNAIFDDILSPKYYLKYNGTWEIIKI